MSSLTFPATIAGDEKALNSGPQRVGSFLLDWFVVREELLSLLAPEVLAVASTLGFVFSRHWSTLNLCISDDSNQLFLGTLLVYCFEPRGREKTIGFLKNNFTNSLNLSFIVIF